MVQGTELESAGKEQVRQDCLPHGVCLVQVRRISFNGVSGGSEKFSVTSESKKDKSAGILDSRGP